MKTYMSHLIQPRHMTSCFFIFKCQRCEGRKRRCPAGLGDDDTTPQKKGDTFATCAAKRVGDTSARMRGAVDEGRKEKNERCFWGTNCVMLRIGHRALYGDAYFVGGQEAHADRR